MPITKAASEPDNLQVVLSVPSQPRMVTTVPGVLRTAHELATLYPSSRIVFCTERRDFVATWGACLTQLRWTDTPADGSASPLSQALDPGAPVLVIEPDGLPDAASLHAFVTESSETPAPSAWTWNGTVIAAFYPKGSQVRRGAFRAALAPPDARRSPAQDGAWQSLVTAEGVRRAEERLWRSLRKETDGYLARLDRTLSIALSRLLIRTSVTPNGITLASLIVGLVGAVLLASVDYWIALLGAGLLWITCVLDGCDGEVARLKLRASRFGAYFDVIADNIVHIAIFLAIPAHVARAHPDFEVWRPAAALIVGVVLSMLSVWWLILRRPDDGWIGARLVYERLASRDFIYVVLLLAALGRLEWFLWAAAIGANLFALSLWLLPLRPRRR